jgi:hypothetical protein
VEDNAPVSPVNGFLPESTNMERLSGWIRASPEKYAKTRTSADAALVPALQHVSRQPRSTTNEI